MSHTHMATVEMKALLICVRHNVFVGESNALGKLKSFIKVATL